MGGQAESAPYSRHIDTFTPPAASSLCRPVAGKHPPDEPWAPGACLPLTHPIGENVHTDDPTCTLTSTSETTSIWCPPPPRHLSHPESHPGPGHLPITLPCQHREFKHHAPPTPPLSNLSVRHGLPGHSPVGTTSRPSLPDPSGQCGA